MSTTHVQDLAPQLTAARHRLVCDWAADAMSAGRLRTIRRAITASDQAIFSRLRDPAGRYRRQKTHRS